MDSYFGISLICLFFQIFGSVNGQPGGGVAIGLGLTGDFMVDTAFGELPSPVVATMATQGVHRTNPANIATQTGGGFNGDSFSLFGSDPNSIFPFDASQIAGVTNGQTIYLPGLVGNPLPTGSIGSSSNTQANRPADSNTNYIFRNEDFTALGNVGHLVRVPADSTPTRSSVLNFGSGSKPSEIALGQSGIISINPNDIIGVADFNQPLPLAAGNPGLMNFNPGSGHVSEISALQSALSGTAVDMSSFLPPPFGEPQAPVNTQPTSVSALPAQVPKLPATRTDGSDVAMMSSDPSEIITSNAVDKGFSNMPANFHSQSNANKIETPKPMTENQGNAVVSHGLDINQSNKKHMGNTGGSILTDPSSNSKHQKLTDSILATAASLSNTVNDQSLFEDPMFNTIPIQDKGLVKESPHVGSTNTDIASMSMLDLEMNQGAGTVPNTPIASTNMANNPTNTMTGSGNSRFGLGGSRFGSFSIPNNIERSNNNPLINAGPKIDTALPSPSAKVERQSKTAQDNRNTSNIPATPPVNEIHVNDLNSEGIFPFEGNMVAMDATLSEGKAAINDMNRALAGHETLHLEPSKTGKTPTSQAIDPDMNNPGMLNESSINIELTHSSSDKFRNQSFETMAVDSDAFTIDSNASINNRNITLVKDNIDEYLQPGSNSLLKQSKILHGNASTGVLVDVNAPQTNLSKSMSIQKAEGNYINTEFTISNTLVSNNNTNISTNQGINATIADMVSGPAMSGLGSGPITNLVGLVPGKVNSGGFAVSGFNKQMHDFSSAPDSSASINNPTLSTFVIGAGQPNEKTISQKEVEAVNANVGGTAIGSGSLDFGRISLPDNAFVSNEAVTKTQKPSEVKKSMKVDMSNMLPPPYMAEVVGSQSFNGPDMSIGLGEIKQQASSVNQNTPKSIVKQNVVPRPNQPSTEQPVVDHRPILPKTETIQPKVEQHSPRAHPVIGSIFGTAESSNSNILTKRFLEKSGLTREPDVDFMTTFLKNAKPSSTVNRGNTNVHIVPFGSDITRTGTQSNNMIFVGSNDANPVDRFGIADISTRQQQLNPSQWQQLMSKISLDANTAPVQNQQPFNYQTQNLIGASETKPLTGSLTSSNLVTPTRNTAPSIQTITGTSRSNSVGGTGFTMFEAPGMTGHSSVNIPHFTQGSLNQQSSFSAPGKPSSTTTTNDAARLNPLVNLQTGAQRTNVNDGTAQVSGPIVQTGSQQQGLLGESGRQIQDEMNTFSLGQSVLITDGNVPDFTKPGSNAQAIQVSPGASPNVQTLGQPAIRSTINTQQSQFQLNAQGSMPQMQLNPGMPVAISGTPTFDRNRNLPLNTNINERPVVSGLPQLGQMTSSNTAQMSGGGNPPAKQPMPPTLFTSGNRLAVFGPANDVSGRMLNTMQAKPIQTTRVGVLASPKQCHYSPDPTSNIFFFYNVGKIRHRIRCALGTAFDPLTCECSIRVSDHGDCLEVHMDFNDGVVVDSSLNRLPIGNENVEVTNSTSPIPGIALFGGDSKLTIWRYQNYDFRDHVMLKAQFRPGVGGQRYQPLISNCDGGVEGPSIAIMYDNLKQEIMLVLKTDNDTRKELTFPINPDEWNDVTYIYDGQEFIGIVNGVRRYVSKDNPHLLGIIGGVIKSSRTQGLVEIRDAAIVLGHCPMYGYFRGAMVDIQIYTCIPKDFRLE